MAVESCQSLDLRLRQRGGDHAQKVDITGCGRKVVGEEGGAYVDGHQVLA